MNIPKYIRDAINKNAFHAKEANKNNKIIREWLEKKGASVDGEHEIVLDMLIDGVEWEGDADFFINYLENYDIN